MGQQAPLVVDKFGHHRVTERVGAVIGALADEALGIKGEPAARRLPDVVVMDVAVQDADILWIRKEPGGDGGAPRVDRPCAGAPLGLCPGKERAKPAIQRYQAGGSRRLRHAVQLLDDLGDDLRGACVLPLFD